MKTETCNPNFDKTLAEVLVERLNELMKDPAVRNDVAKLFTKRVPCCETTVNHPTLQLGSDGTLGLLGLLNGLVGTIPYGPKTGYGYITAEVDEDTDEPIHFELTAESPPTTLTLTQIQELSKQGDIVNKLAHSGSRTMAADVDEQLLRDLLNDISKERQ
jgi:hypothetical protein